MFGNSYYDFDKSQERIYISEKYIGQVHSCILTEAFQRELVVSMYSNDNKLYK